MSNLIKQNVLLVAPYKGPVGINDMFVAPNFGLYRIKFYIQNKFPNISVDVLYPNLESVDFNAKKYDYIGFNLTHTTLEHDIGLIYRAKKESQDSILMAGGIEATFIHDWLIKSAPLDLVVLGEGEEILEQLFQNNNSAVGLKNILQIPGLVIRDKNGEPKKTLPGRFLDQERFSYISSLLDFSQVSYPVFWNANASQYREPNPQEINAIRIFTGNYCPHKCTFCSSTNFLDYSYSKEGDVNKRTKVVRLIAEDTMNMIVRAYYAYNMVKTIIIDDDNFVMSLDRVNLICQMIIASKKKGEIPEDLTFTCQARVDNFRTDKAKVAMSLMKDAGFRLIMYGVESFSKKVLEEFGKSTDIGLIENVLEQTQNTGINSLVYLILFSPRSTKKDLWKTMMKSLNCLSKGMEVSINFYIMDIPGSYYQKEKDLIREYKKIPIVVNGTEVATIAKSEWLYPFDKELRNLANRVEEEYPEHEDFFKSKFGIKHIPGRIYTYIVFYAILELMGCHKEKKELLEIFQKYNM